MMFLKHQSQQPQYEYRHTSNHRIRCWRSLINQWFKLLDYQNQPLDENGIRDLYSGRNH